MIDNIDRTIHWFRQPASATPLDIIIFGIVVVMIVIIIIIGVRQKDD